MPSRTGKTRGSVRMCAACRSRAPKPELVRIVWRLPTGLCIDGAHCEQSRGIYVHRRLHCVEKLMNVSLFEKGIRLKKGLVTQQHCEGLVRELRAQVLSVEAMVEVSHKEGRQKGKIFF